MHVGVLYDTPNIRTTLRLSTTSSGEAGVTSSQVWFPLPAAPASDDDGRGVGKRVTSGIASKPASERSPRPRLHAGLGTP